MTEKSNLKSHGTNNIDTVFTKVIHGGPLSSRKGVNLPHTKVSLPSLTEKDIQDARFALSHDVDWIALSFVRSARDIEDLRILVKQEKKTVRIVAKIEKPEAVKEIDDIIDASRCYYGSQR